MYRLMCIPNILNLLLISFVFSLAGCGGGGGGGGSTSTTPPVIQNPLNGIWTFANGVQVDMNIDPTDPRGATFMGQRLDLSTWAYPYRTQTYLVNPVRDPNQYAGVCALGVHPAYIRNSSIGQATQLVVTYPDDGAVSEQSVWGPPDIYWLVTALDGGIYMMEFVGGGSNRNDFAIIDAKGSPRIFLPPSKHVGNSWIGGMLGKSTMTIEAVNATSPDGITGCYKLNERFTDVPSGHSIAIDWWYVVGSGFVGRYNVDNHRFYSVIPVVNG